MVSQKAMREREFRRIESDFYSRTTPNHEREQASFLDGLVDNFVGRVKYGAAYSSFLSNYFAACYARNWQSKPGFIEAAKEAYDEAVSAYRNHPKLRQGKAGEGRKWGLINFRLLLWDEENKMNANHGVLSPVLTEMVAGAQEIGEYK